MLAVVSVGRVPVPDERYEWLVEHHKPVRYGNCSRGLYGSLFGTELCICIFSKVPAFLLVTDIAGLVQGASEGKVWIIVLKFQKFVSNVFNKRFFFNC